MTAPVLFAPEGEPCGTCGSPLAADQRYCLTCGTRRADARLPFLDILRHEGTGHVVPFTAGPGYGAVAPAPVPPGGLTERARANTGLIASVGVLLLAMLIGVLVGSGFARSDNGTAAADQKPVVVSVGGVAAAPAATAGTDTTASDATAGGTASGKKAAKRAKKANASAQKSPVKVKTASKSKLKSIDKLSGAAYQKQIDKLGKNIAVGGKPPPKDNKPAAGGGSFQEIG